jgi:effector-binding domain-containing protein
MRVQMIAPLTFFYATSHTSFSQIIEPIMREIPVLQHLIASGQVKSSGPILLIYHDPSENLDARFDLDIGLPIRESRTADGEFHIRPLPTFRCATVIFRGPMKFLPAAYNKLIPDMIAGGLNPSGETRESYLVWKGASSPDNVVQIEVGIH